MKNVKLMQDLLNQIKTYLLQGDNSLAEALAQLRVQINDIEKVNFNAENSELEHAKNIDKLHHVCNKINQFKWEYDCLCSKLQNMMQTINTIDHDHKLFNHNFGSNAVQCDVYPNTAERDLVEKKEKEAAVRAEHELKAKIEQAKKDLTGAEQVEHA